MSLETRIRAEYDRIIAEDNPNFTYDDAKVARTVDSGLEWEIATLSSANGTISYIYRSDTILTDAQKADIEASSIDQKHNLPRYLDMCAQLRADDPNLSDLMVRTLAKGAI